MSQSWIKSAAQAKRAAYVEAQRPQWTGEAKRQDMPRFKSAHYAAAQLHGVPYAQG